METESNDTDSNCIITNIIESRGRVLKINEEEPFLKDVNLNMKKVSASRVFAGMVTV